VGSIPTASTNSYTRLDHSRPHHKPMILMGFPLRSPLVREGLDLTALTVRWNDPRHAPMLHHTGAHDETFFVCQGVGEKSPVKTG